MTQTESPISPAPDSEVPVRVVQVSERALHYYVMELLEHSITCRGRWEMVNPATGDYRLVVEGKRCTTYP